MQKLQGQIDSVKDTADAVVNLDGYRSVFMGSNLKSRGSTYNNVVVSLKDWDEAYGACPFKRIQKLAGEMRRLTAKVK